MVGDLLTLTVLPTDSAEHCPQRTLPTALYPLPRPRCNTATATTGGGAGQRCFHQDIVAVADKVMQYRLENRMLPRKSRLQYRVSCIR